MLEQELQQSKKKGAQVENELRKEHAAANQYNPEEKLRHFQENSAMMEKCQKELLLQIQSQGRKLPHILSRILPGASIPPTFNMTRFKLTVVGDLAVGKTSLVNCFTECEFMESEVTLAALPSERYPVITAEGENVLLEIWDTPGKEDQLTPL